MAYRVSIPVADTDNEAIQEIQQTQARDIEAICADTEETTVPKISLVWPVYKIMTFLIRFSSNNHLITSSKWRQWPSAKY